MTQLYDIDEIHEAIIEGSWAPGRDDDCAFCVLKATPSGVVPTPRPKVPKPSKPPPPKKTVTRPGLHKETRNIIQEGKSVSREVWVGAPKIPTEAKIAGHAAKATSPDTHQHSHYY